MEIFLPGRGRDRTSPLGAAVLHWADEGYRVWWPNWTGLPYVIYARLNDLDVDGRKEIVAVLEPDKFDDAHYVPGKVTAKRELGVWKIQ